MNTEIEKFEARLTEGKHQLAAKAGQDAAFHETLTKSPNDTIEKFFGLPAGTLKNVAVEVYEEKPKSIGIIIPPRPQDSGAELSEEQLESVAGGAVFTVAGTAAIIGGVIGTTGTLAGHFSSAGISRGW